MQTLLDMVKVRFIKSSWTCRANGPSHGVEVSKNQNATETNMNILTNDFFVLQVLSFAMSEGKVAVHCHAGLGRTGVLIAAYLVRRNFLVLADCSRKKCTFV